jgi:hypothetical protein
MPASRPEGTDALKNVTVERSAAGRRWAFGGPKNFGDFPVPSDAFSGITFQRRLRTG